MDKIRRVHYRTGTSLSDEQECVLGCHDEAFIVVVIVDRLLLELDHTADELLDAIRSMDDAIRFVEGGEVTLDLVTHRAWTMLLVAVSLVTPRWTCFFGLDGCLEILVDDEGCPCAIAEIAEGEVTPLPRLGHHEDLPTALHSKTKALGQVIDVFSLEVSQALLAPVKGMTPCCFDVGHECGEVFDPCVLPIVCLVGDCCSCRLPVEQVDGVG